MGFPFDVLSCTRSECNDRAVDGTAFTVLIPDMKFTCTGTVVKWRAAGVIDYSGTVNAMVGIWRRQNGRTRTYDKIATIELGICGRVNSTLVTGTRNVYECVLPRPMSVQQGDIAGIEIARLPDYRFGLHIVTDVGSTNYVFRRMSQIATATLSDSDLLFTAQPQFSLTVISETVSPTEEVTRPVELPTTTQASITTLATGTTPSTTSTSQATVIVESTTTAAEIREGIGTATTLGPTTEDDQHTTGHTTTDAQDSAEDLTTAAISERPTITTTALDNVAPVIESSTDVSLNANVTSTGQPNEAGSGISVGATIAGIIVASVAAILLVIAIILLSLVMVVLRKRRNSHKNNPPDYVANLAYDGELL